MPIFVSRFSAVRSGLANFQALRTSNKAPQQGRTSGRQDQASAEEEDQAGSTAEGARSETRLLVSSQRADQISQQVAGRTEAETPSGSTTTGRRVTTAASRPAVASRNTFAPARFTATAQTSPPAQDQSRQQARTAGLLPEGRTVQITLRPVLRTTVDRLEGLTRLISSQRRELVDADGGGTVTARARLASSLRVQETAATTNVVRTAQAAQTALAEVPAEAELRGGPVTTFSTASRAAEGGPRAEERLRETTDLKQNLREDVATVTRGLLKDTIRGNAQTARRVAQGILQAQQVRESDTLRPSALRTQLNQRPPLAQAVSSNRRRSSPAIPNMSGLRSALALLGTNVNILVG